MKIDRTNITALVQAEILSMIDEDDSAWLHRKILKDPEVYAIWQHAYSHFERPEIQEFINRGDAEKVWETLLVKDLKE